jgi:glycosyltransferase involved in cell wall biosynthesis
VSARFMRVLFINRYFYPDHSATSQMLTDLASDLQRDGLDITVITGRQLIDDPRARLAVREQVEGIDVHRVWSSRFGRATLVGRAIDYLSFYAGAGWRLARLCRPGDVVVAKTDPPLISVIAALVTRWRGAHLVNWLHDLFPEIAERLELGLVRGQPARALRALRDASLRAAAMNVAIGTRMAEQLTGLGIEAARVTVIHNWCDGRAVRPRPRAGHRLRREWQLDERFVVMYSGNMGYAHEFDTVLDAAARLRLRSEVLFLFIGGGVQRARIEQQVRSRGLENVQFKPYQPRERLGESLTAADAHLVCLRPQLEGLMVPSKFYAVAAAGRPILLVGAGGGELAGLVAEAQCGCQVAPGAGAVLAERIAELAADPRLGQRQGLAARHLFETRFDRPVAARAWRLALAGAGACAEKRPAAAS